MNIRTQTLDRLDQSLIVVVLSDCYVNVVVMTALANQNVPDIATVNPSIEGQGQVDDCCIHLIVLVLLGFRYPCGSLQYPACILHTEHTVRLRPVERLFQLQLHGILVHLIHKVVRLVVTCSLDHRLEPKHMLTVAGVKVLNERIH